MIRLDVIMKGCTLWLWRRRRKRRGEEEVFNQWGTSQVLLLFLAPKLIRQGQVNIWPNMIILPGSKYHFMLLLLSQSLCFAQVCFASKSCPGYVCFTPFRETRGSGHLSLLSALPKLSKRCHSLSKHSLPHFWMVTILPLKCQQTST